MEKKRWFHFIVSAVSLVLSLALDLYYPDVKDVLCTNLPSNRANHPDNNNTTDRTQPTNHNLDREK
jgi:hypothetical protein